MSVPGAVSKILAAIRKGDESVTAFRATVTAVDGSLISIIRDGFTAADDEKYASLTRFLLAVGDVVFCVPLGVGGKPVIVDVIRRAAAAAPVPSVLPNAGTTATTSLSHGDDTSGLILLTPNGAGIAAGTVVQLDFAVARPSATGYTVMLTRLDLIAGTADFRFTGQTAARFRIYTPIVLTAGSQYAIGYHVRQDAN